MHRATRMTAHSYKFGTVDAAGVRSSLYSDTSIATFGSSLMLPEGNNTLFACVSDSDGAQTCETTIVTVKKDEGFCLSDAVSKFDVGHLTSTNDVGVLAAGASALQSMSAYAQQQITGDGASGGNGTSSSGADEEEKKKLQEEIDTKAGALINSLANNADDLVSDPQSMQQVISAAAALIQTSSASSQETQSNLLSIAQAGLQSAQMSNKGVSSDQISQIISIAAVGTGTTQKSNKDSSSSGGSGGGGKSKTSKRLLSVAGASVAADAPAAWHGGVRQILSSLPLTRPNRRLQQDTTPADSPAPAAIKGAAILSVIGQAAELMLQQSTPATGLLSMASQGLSVSTANLLGSTYAETQLAVGEALEAAAGSSSNKAASTTAADNVLVELSAPLLGVCEATEGSPASNSTGCTDSTVSVVLQYYQDATLLLNTDVVAALEAGGNATNATDGTASSTNTAAAADPLQGLQVVSGAVVLAVTGANADEQLPCLNTSSSSSSSGDNVTLPEGCGALLTLPIFGELDTNSSKELVVLRINSSGVPVQDGVLLGVSNSSNTAASSTRRLLAGTATTAQVWTSKSGTFMMGQVTRAGESIVANDTSGSNQTAPGNTTACGNTTLDANATGCNTTDANATITSNTTDANATVTSSTTDLNSTGTSNTTSPETPPPDSNTTVSNTTSDNSTVSSNTTSNATAPDTNATSNATAPGSNTTSNASDTANQTSPEQQPTVPSPSPSPAAAASPSPSPSPPAGSSDTTVALNLTFPMKFSELSSSQALLDTFKADVAANVAQTLGIDASLVEVVNIREGSVKCDVIVLIPASFNSSQAAELQAAVGQLVAAPDAALGDVKTKYNILQPITAAVWEPPPATSVVDAGLAAVAAQLARLSKAATVGIIIGAVAAGVAIAAVIAVIWWARRRGRQAAANRGFDATIFTAGGSAAGFPDLSGSPPAVSETAVNLDSRTTHAPGSKGTWKLAADLETTHSAGSGGMIGTRAASEPYMQQHSSAHAPVVEVLMGPPGQQTQQTQQRASAAPTSLATGPQALPRSSAVLAHAPGSPISPHAAARVAKLPALPDEVLKRMQNVRGGAASGSSSPRASDASHQH